MPKQFINNSEIDEQQTIWRYMNFEKFVSFILFNKLYFCRIDKLSDPFEGMRSKPTKEWLLKLYEVLQLNVVKDDLELVFEKARQYYMVNCWHKSSCESDAMWKLYGGNGIAVKSSIKNLFESFSNPLLLELYFGSVEYIDYWKQPSSSSPGAELFLYKQKCFEQEQEFRVITFTTKHEIGADGWSKPVNNGIYLDIDIERLIEEVYISPLAQEWMQPLVEKLLGEHGYKNIMVHPSRILTRPCY